MEKWQRKTYPLQDNGRRRLTMVNCLGYEKREADRLGIQYVDKVEDLQKGPAWFRTADDYIVHCFKVETRQDDSDFRRYRFSTDVGSLTCVYKYGKLAFVTPVSFATFKASGFAPVATKNDHRKDYRDRRSRIFIKAYVSMVMRGVTVNYELLGRILKPRDLNFTARAKRTLKYAEVERMIDAEMKKELELNGVTMKAAIDKMEEAYNIAKGKKDAQTMVRVAENYMDIFKKNAQPSNPHGMPELEGPGLADALERAERQLAGKPEPTSDDITKKALTDYVVLEQDSLMDEINELLTKPELPKLPG